MALQGLVEVALRSGSRGVRNLGNTPGVIHLIKSLSFFSVNGMDGLRMGHGYHTLVVHFSVRFLALLGLLACAGSKREAYIGT